MNELKRTAEELRQSLDAIEPFLTRSDTSTTDLENFKATLDRLRTNVQAIAVSDHPSDHAESVRRFRLKRAAQVCQGVLKGFADGSITAATPGLGRFRTTVEETLEYLGRLPRVR